MVVSTSSRWTWPRSVSRSWTSQQLKQVVTTLRMVPIFEAVNVPFATQKLTENGQVAPDPAMEEAAAQTLDELLRVTRALRWAGAEVLS